MLSESNQTSHIVRIIWNIQIQLQAVQSVHDQVQRRFATVEIEVYRGKDWNASGLTVKTLWDCFIMNPSCFVLIQNSQNSEKRYPTFRIIHENTEKMRKMDKKRQQRDCKNQSDIL